MKIKVLVADDDALIRDGLNIILSADGRFEIVKCVENGLEALQICQTEAVDVALLDVRMPVMDGLQAARAISEETATKVLILTTFDDDDFITKAVKNGARGYLLKNSPPTRIMDAIKLVHEGGIVMQDTTMEKLKEMLGDRKTSGIPQGLLTERELEIVKLISNGHSNKEIAKELFMSEGTVKNYITAILDKTGLEHRTQIAIYYLTGNKTAST